MKHLLAALSVAALASAINIRAFSGSSCTGTRWVCIDIAPGACCTFPGDFYSLGWTLPEGSRGIAYTFDNCWIAYPTLNGPVTNMCYDYRGLIQPSSAKWEYSNTIIAEVEKPTEECRQPDVYIYTTPKGEMRIIDIPEGQANQVAEYEKNKDWEKLAGFADSTRTIDLEVAGKGETLVGPTEEELTAAL